MYKIIKIILAVLLLLCLARMPYSYYQLVRFVAFVGFSILAYGAYQQKSEKITIIYIALAVLFQPFVKIALGRELWNVVDVLVAIWLIYTIVTKKGDLIAEENSKADNKKKLDKENLD